MKISDDGLKFIKKEEGCVLHIYRDLAGLETVGVGHLLTPDDKVTGRFINGITDEQAIELLRSDVSKAETDIAKLVKVPLTQNQYDALCSFVFNLGGGALGISTLLKLINAGEYTKAAAQFPSWDKVRDPKTKKLVSNKGLAGRRKREMELWLKQ